MYKFRTVIFPIKYFSSIIFDHLVPALVHIGCAAGLKMYVAQKSFWRFFFFSSSLEEYILLLIISVRSTQAFDKDLYFYQCNIIYIVST